jgi:putative ABC transport system substrate-binding protein
VIPARHDRKNSEGAMMRRRELLATVGGAVVMWPLATRGQQPAMPVVGFLSPWPASPNDRGLAVFRKTLAEAGYVDGQNVSVDYRSADGQFNRLPALAAELVARGVAVIVAPSLPAEAAARAATKTIPILLTAGSDPLELERLESLIRADGNIAVVSQVLPPLAPKRAAIIHELLPGATNVGFLDNPGAQADHAPSESAEITAAGRALGMRIEVLEARTRGDVEEAFRTLIRQRAEALIVSPHPFFITMRPNLAVWAKLHAIPTIFPYSEDAEAGGLTSYGNSNFDIFRQMGLYAARILAGGRPGDLPAMQPAVISLTINLETAKKLNITVPGSLLARADRVIQ